MAIMELVPESQPEPEARLLITIGNERPISAEEVGRLIRELGSDYRRQTGGTLVLTKLELGSTLLELADQVVIYTAYVGAGLIVIEATERLAQFYRFLASQLTSPAPSQPTLEPPLNASPARLLEIAANSGANLEIIKGVGKSKEVIRLTRAEVNTRNANAKERKKSKISAAQAALPKPEAALQIEHLSGRLRAQAAAAPEQMESLVELFVDFLISQGAEYHLQALAKDLDSHGLYEMATVVRRHIKPSPTERQET